MRLNNDIERLRREVLTARDRAYAAKNWAEVDRLTGVLATLPVKRSDGTYGKLLHGND